MLIGLFVIPRLLHMLGTERFGILTLAWAVTGYFTFFDFGLGRALTKLVAEKAHANDSALVGSVWTALLLMFATGSIAGIALALVTPWLVRSVLHISAPLQAEAARGFIA
jgi:O-antigen/teichoic acid export membrane protein